MEQEQVVKIFARQIAREQIAGNYSAVESIRDLAQQLGFQVPVREIQAAIRELRKRVDSTWSLQACLVCIQVMVRAARTGDFPPESALALAELYEALFEHLDAIGWQPGVFLPSPVEMTEIYSAGAIPEAFQDLLDELDLSDL
jgi:hypothetical protein